MVAILGHETAHHCLIPNDVRWPAEEYYEEIMTDLAACYLGFGHMLFLAYHPDATLKGKLGYVDADTLWRAMKIAAKWRKLGESAVQHAIRSLRTTIDAIERGQPSDPRPQPAKRAKRYQRRR